MTEKLYWSDPLLTSFDTAGVRLAEHAGKPSLVLDRTLFYPEGGGQLGDRGTITIGSWTAQVTDTQMDDAGTIHHVLADRPPEDVAASFTADVAVHGTIDAKRRLDHMAQHTGQHALSRALADVARAETVSARLGATACTIDVQRAAIPESELHEAEDLVNELIASNVEVRALYPGPDELAKLPLRKQPKVTEDVVRIIEIDGFDMTPCGGTHCTRTGQIGQVRIVGIEKYKGMLRLTFHAGMRALFDARSKHEILAKIAAGLSCRIDDVPFLVRKAISEINATCRQLETVRAELVDLVAKTMLAKLPSPDAAPGPLVVHVLRENDDLGALRRLAGKLATDPRVVAIAAANDPASGELVLVVQRGSAAPFDCGAFIQAQAKARSGRGGGRPERAEGRFPRGTSLEVLAASAQSVMAS